MTKLHLDVSLRRVRTGEATHLIVDSTGLSIVGEGEWAAAKHGGKGQRGWKKLHLGVDRSGVIVAQALTDGTADDAKTGLSLTEEGLLMEGDTSGLAEVCVGRNPEPRAWPAGLRSTDWSFCRSIPAIRGLDCWLRPSCRRSGESSTHTFDHRGSG